MEQLKIFGRVCGVALALLCAAQCFGANQNLLWQFYTNVNELNDRAVAAGSASSESGIPEAPPMDSSPGASAVPDKTLQERIEEILKKKPATTGRAIIQQLKFAGVQFSENDLKGLKLSGTLTSAKKAEIVNAFSRGTSAAGGARASGESQGDLLAELKRRLAARTSAGSSSAAGAAGASASSPAGGASPAASVDENKLLADYVSQLKTKYIDPIKKAVIDEMPPSVKNSIEEFNKKLIGLGTSKENLLQLVEIVALDREWQKLSAEDKKSPAKKDLFKNDPRFTAYTRAFDAVMSKLSEYFDVNAQAERKAIEELRAGLIQQNPDWSNSFRSIKTLFSTNKHLYDQAVDGIQLNPDKILELYSITGRLREWAKENQLLLPDDFIAMMKHFERKQGMWAKYTINRLKEPWEK